MPETVRVDNDSATDTGPTSVRAPEPGGNDRTTGAPDTGHAEGLAAWTAWRRSLLQGGPGGSARPHEQKLPTHTAAAWAAFLRECRAAVARLSDGYTFGAGAGSRAEAPEADAELDRVSCLLREDPGALPKALQVLGRWETTWAAVGVPRPPRKG